MRSAPTVNQPKISPEPGISGISSDHDTFAEAAGAVVRAGLGAPDEARPLLYLAACSLVAALIHYWLIPEHYAQWWGYGTFFTASAIAQGFCAGALVFWPRRIVLQAGIAGTVAILLLYVVTRTVGIPFFGPDAGSVEHVEALDLVSAAADTPLHHSVVEWLSAPVGGLQIGETSTLRERSSDLGRPQIRRSQARLGDDLGLLAQYHLEMQAGAWQHPSPSLARAMGLDEEPLASEGGVRHKTDFGVSTRLLQHIQLPRQLHGEVLVQRDVEHEGADVVCHGRQIA